MNDDNLTKCNCGRAYFYPSFKHGNMCCHICKKESKERVSKKAREVLSNQNVQDTFRKYSKDDDVNL